MQTRVLVGLPLRIIPSSLRSVKLQEPLLTREKVAPRRGELTETAKGECFLAQKKGVLK